ARGARAEDDGEAREAPRAHRELPGRHRGAAPAPNPRPPLPRPRRPAHSRQGARLEPPPQQGPLPCSARRVRVPTPPARGRLARFARQGEAPPRGSHGGGSAVMKGNRASRLPRREQLADDPRHDSYKAKGKLPDPTRCPECSALFQKGRWTWNGV